VINRENTRSCFPGAGLHSSFFQGGGGLRNAKVDLHKEVVGRHEWLLLHEIPARGGNFFRGGVKGKASTRFIEGCTS
jgi:hypothetical protein